ncbi:DNA internalization-related competence protein ComEC/Rec2 [Acetobacter malorum]|uniref:DNA internalization-related competence protein ComEC/Rec2 n=1 Tax=Acetobacter malorum TaxID=178901 RepID=A0A177G7Y2_9PROT|nr:DNA internalization-related competence protein ComEC/Rec2 [Acetobacter malorum]
MPLLTAALLAEQRQLVLWVPVGMALGVLVYFLLPQEPGALWGVGLPAAGLALGLGVLVAGWLSLWARLAGWGLYGGGFGICICMECGASPAAHAGVAASGGCGVGHGAVRHGPAPTRDRRCCRNATGCAGRSQIRNAA